MNSFLKNLLKPTLNKKLISIMLLLSLSLIVSIVYLYEQTENAFYEEFERQIEDLLRAIQIGMEQASGLSGADEKSLKNYLASLNSKGVNEISIISSTDKIVSSTNTHDVGKWISKNKKEMIFKAELGHAMTGKGEVYNVMIPVISEDRNLGYVQLKINTDYFSELLHTSAMRRIAVTIVVFAIGMTLAVFLSWRYTKPIEQIAQAANSVAEGDLTQELDTSRKDEIGELSRSFNYMIGRLRDERTMAERLRKAEHMAGIGEVSQSIAHEIKNPLNFISLSIDHMREAYRPEDEDKAERYGSLLVNMKGEIQRVSRFVESFLEHGRPINLKRRQTEIGPIIADVVELVSAKAMKERITIERSFDAGATLFIDPEFIKTCLYNIVLNAFQATPEGGTLRIEAGRIDGSYHISVEDTGAGLPPDLAAKVFDPFFTTKADGLGLGLVLTKRVIEEHGGKVSFESVLGQGSTVTILLPIDKESL